MIYLASPYSHPDRVIRNQRFLCALNYSNRCLKRGESIFSPIVYGHVFAEFGLAKTDHLSWLSFNETMLGLASEIRVLTLPGWKDSLGIEHELAFAEARGIPVTYAVLDK